jgi:hypothetical protein
MAAVQSALEQRCITDANMTTSATFTVTKTRVPGIISSLGLDLDDVVVGVENEDLRKAGVRVAIRPKAAGRGISCSQRTST